MHTCPFCTEKYATLITVRKGGLTKRVCAACLPAAMRLGWVPD